MTELRTDFRPMNRGCAALLATMGTMLLCAVLEWTGAPRGWFLASFLLVFVFGFIAWQSWGRLFCLRYWCPQCRNRIPKPTVAPRKPGDPLHFYCSACDIEWDTGLSVPTWV
jgi:hypothetical protein